MRRTKLRRVAEGIALVLTSGCAASPPSNVPPPVSATPVATAAPGVAPATPTTVASAAPKTAVTNDRCAVSAATLVLPKRAGVRGFDVGSDGRIHWVESDIMSGELQVLARAPADYGAKPERLAGAKLHGDPAELVVARDGFWLRVDDSSRGMCGSKVFWLARGADRAIPVTAPACVFGPARGVGEVAALWATSPTYSHALDVVLAKGPPPSGLAPLGRKVEGTFELVAQSSDGVYMALDGGEVVRKRPDGGEERVAPKVHESPSSSPLANAVQGDSVFVASSKNLSKIDLFRIPRSGGTRAPIASFDVDTTTSARLLASEGGLVLHLIGKRGADRLLLVDPTRACPDLELPSPSLGRRVLVDRDVVHVQQDRGIVAISLAARVAGRSAAP